MPDSCDRLQATAVASLVLVGLLAVTGCVGNPTPRRPEVRIVLERGRSAQHQPWQLAASLHNGRLGLYLEGPSGNMYSGSVGFAAGPSAGYWTEGLGPGRSDFVYGPAPAAAVTVQLSAPGHAPLLVRTRPIPARAGLPRGRFFIAQSPGGGWNVTLLNAAGRRVAFENF